MLLLYKVKGDYKVGSLFIYAAKIEMSLCIVKYVHYIQYKFLYVLDVSLLAKVHCEPRKLEVGQTNIVVEVYE